VSDDGLAGLRSHTVDDVRSVPGVLAELI